MSATNTAPIRRTAMKYCRYLNNDLNLEPDALQPCCNIRGIGVPRFSFSGGEVDMAAYRRHIMDTLAAMQESKGMCSGCPEAVDIDLPPNARLGLEIRFRTISINKHRHLCNCRCVYCTLWHKTADSYAVLPVLQSLKEQDALDDACFFSWGGGEPTLLKEFAETSRWIMDEGYRQYVHSNALRYSEAVGELLRRDRGMVNISLDSGTSATYRTVKGVDAYGQVVDSLCRYAADAADKRAVHVKYVLFESNNSARDIVRFLELCRRLGLVNVQLSLDFRESVKKTVSDKTLEAAALLMRGAEEMGLCCTPFFIDGEYLEKIRQAA